MDAYAIRQPIFDSTGAVFGYQIVFDLDLTDVFQAHQNDQATLKAINDAFVLVGLDRLTHGHPAFITLPHDIIINGYASLLPAELTVIEIPAAHYPSQELLDILDKLRADGYRLALAGLDIGTEDNPLLSRVEMVRADFQLLTDEDRVEIAELFHAKGMKIIAENLTTQEEHSQAVSLGYDLFQGIFFCEPTIVAGRDLPAFKGNHLRLLKELNQSEMDVRGVEDVIKREVALSYKLLRYINSASFGLRSTISNVRQAVMLLGERGMKQWASVAVMSDLVSDRPLELMCTSVQRARFAEEIARASLLRNRANDLFTMGLFSLMDAIVGRPLEEIIREISMAEDVRDTLLGEPGPLREVYDLVVAYERGQWIQAFKLAKSIGVSPPDLRQMYLGAIDWANASAA
ncbi:MAG: HDOD domain-containing protein [Chloroflexota bacterium]